MNTQMKALQRMLAAFLVCIFISTPVLESKAWNIEADNTQTVSGQEETVSGQEETVSGQEETVSSQEETTSAENTIAEDAGSSDKNEQENILSGADILSVLNATSEYEISTSIDSRWESGYTGTVTLKNIGDKNIDNWYLKLTHQDKITSIWNASIVENDNGELLIKNAKWNQDIAPGNTVIFGYQAQYEDEIHEPEKFELCVQWKEADKEIYETDYVVTSNWEEIYMQSAFTIKNTGESVIEDWTISFAYAGEITEIWNAEILSRQSGCYIIKNAGHNQNIGSGLDISFGFQAEGEIGAEPTDIHLYTVVPLTGEEIPEEEPETDNDNDNIPDDREEALGFDPSMEDTDGDGLPDGYEIYTLYPLLLESGYPEENGMNPDDDYDKDGLTNLEEYHLGTNPGLEDTDGDRIRDYEEVNMYGTNPLLMDSDEDGLCDGTEVEAGLDPADPDTDEDSIWDGEETTTQTLTTQQKEETAIIPTLQITGTGDYHEKLEITERQDKKNWDNMDFLVGEAYEFAHKEELVFDEAVLTFRLTEDVLAIHNLEDLSFAWYDETNGIFELLDTTHDATLQTIQAKVSHFSTYVVVNKNIYYSNLSTCHKEDSLKTYEYNGHGYALIDIGMSWSEAVEYCEQLGGKLVVINDKEEQQFLTNLIKGKGTKYTYYIGLTGMYHQYSWIDGTPLSYTNWAYKEPNYGKEDVVQMYRITRSNAHVGGWNDTYNYVAGGEDYFYSSFNCGSICEFEGANEEGEYPVVLSDGQLVYLKANPAEFNEEVDTDEDGIPDMVELGEQITLTVPENYGIHTEPTSFKEVTAWTYRSNPAEKDTDGDGYEDGNDPYPKRFDINITQVYDTNVIKLNTGSVYRIFAQDIKRFYEQYYIRTLLPNKEELELKKSLLDANRANHYTSDEVTLFCLIDENGVKDYMKDEYLYFWKEVYRKFTGTEGSNYEVICFFDIHQTDVDWDVYTKDALNQIVKGNYAENVNLMGTLGELGLAFTGIDVVQDVRDLSYDVLYWNKEWQEIGWGHAAITGVDALSVLPVIGMIGKADEVWALCRRADDLFVLKRLTNFEIADKIAQAGTLDAKYLANTAGIVLKEIDADTYREILESCETVAEYKQLYGGSYNNEVIEDIVKRVNNGELDGEVSAELVEEVLSGVRKGSNAVTSAKEYANIVSKKIKVYGSYQEAMSASDVLRSELYAAGIPNPPYRNATHHIIPWNDPRALDARNILDDYGIEYNSAANGVFLPMETNEYVGDATQHLGNHSAEYVNVVTTRLQEVVDAGGSTQDIVSAINMIREGLLDGTIKLN